MSPKAIVFSSKSALPSLYLKKNVGQGGGNEWITLCWWIGLCSREDTKESYFQNNIER